MISWPSLFVAAGVWNISTGAVYLGFRSQIARRFGVGLAPGGDPSDRVLANLLHIYFGVAAFWIATDPGNDLHLISLWIATKLTSVALAAARYKRSSRQPSSKLALLPALADIAWSAAFLYCLMSLG